MEFEGVIIAQASYPVSLVVKEHAVPRNSCNFGYLTIDPEKQEARIYEV